MRGPGHGSPSHLARRQSCFRDEHVSNRDRLADLRAVHACATGPLAPDTWCFGQAHRQEGEWLFAEGGSCEAQLRGLGSPSFSAECLVEVWFLLVRFSPWGPRPRCSRYLQPALCVNGKGTVCLLILWP